MPTMSRIFGSLLILLSALFHVQAGASVAMETRVVFSAKAKEVTVRLANPGNQPVFVQAWLDKGDMNEDVSAIDLPFVLTPAIFRMEAGAAQVVRIMYTGEPLPTDKESLYWLNVLDVPPKPTIGEGQSSVQLAIRTRVKLMYRPEGLQGTAEAAPNMLVWTVGVNQRKQTVLKAKNPSPYVVNLAGIEVQAAGKKLDAGLGYVLPGEEATFVVEHASGIRLGGAKVVYSSVNDWGGNGFHEAILKE